MLIFKVQYVKPCQIFLSTKQLLAWTSKYLKSNILTLSRFSCNPILEVFTCICIFLLYLISAQLIFNLLSLSAWICTNVLLLATQWPPRRWDGNQFYFRTTDKGISQRRPLWSLLPFTKQLAWAKSVLSSSQLGYEEPAWKEPLSLLNRSGNSGAGIR